MSEKKKTKTNKKLFQKGGPGGPGRGKGKKALDDNRDPIEIVEEILKDDLLSKTKATRTKAIQLYIQFAKLKLMLKSKTEDPKPMSERMSKILSALYKKSELKNQEDIEFFNSLK